MSISIIIPVHEYNETVEPLLLTAIESVAKQSGHNELPEVVIVAPPSVVNATVPVISAEDRGVSISFVTNEGETDYQSQVNLAVKSLSTEYFSVLEFDDDFSAAFIKNAEKHIKYYPKVDIFLTMMIEVNNENQSIKQTNETVWAQQFVGENGEMGYLNVNSLKQYTDFKLSGAVINTEEFLNIGGYKPNIKLTFMYEFLLRALNNASVVFTIPKIGYKHLATREGSLFDDYLKNMSINERKFWFETATKESNFINDRPIDITGISKVVSD